MFRRSSLPRHRAEFNNYHHPEDDMSDGRERFDSLTAVIPTDPKCMEMISADNVFAVKCICTNTLS